MIMEASPQTTTASHTGHQTQAVLDPKQYTIKDAEELTSIIKADCDPDYILKDIAENILPKLHRGDKRQRRQAIKLLGQKKDNLTMITGLRNHYHIADAVGARYRPLVIKMTKDIELEYNCTVAVEKSLAEIIALAYIQMIDIQQRIKSILNSIKYADNEINGYIAVLSKEKDRSSHQYILALTTLKQMKQPSLKICIKAGNAFVAQNQQINDNRQQP